jgi:hypothetical protein
MKTTNCAKKQDVKIEADVSLLVKIKVRELPSNISVTKTLSQEALNRLVSSVMEFYSDNIKSHTLER